MDWSGELLLNEVLGYKITIFRLLLSLLLGGIVGIERQQRKQSAGFRTFAMITVGTTLMMLISINLGLEFKSDTARLAAQVISGIGFLGAGTIIQSSGAIRGMTTASCIWAMAAVGLGVGAGMYVESVIGTLIVLFILVGLEKFEQRARIEWQPRKLVLLFEELDFDEQQIISILKEEDIDAYQLGVEQNLAQRETKASFLMYIKLNTQYSGALIKLRGIPHLKNVTIVES